MRGKTDGESLSLWNEESAGSSGPDVCTHALRQTNTFILSLTSQIPKAAFVKVSGFEVGLWRRSLLYSKVPKNLLVLFLVPDSMYAGYLGGEPEVVTPEALPTTGIVRLPLTLQTELWLSHNKRQLMSMASLLHFLPPPVRCSLLSHR